MHLRHSHLAQNDLLDPPGWPHEENPTWLLNRVPRCLRMYFATAQRADWPPMFGLWRSPVPMWLRPLFVLHRGKVPLFLWWPFFGGVPDISCSFNVFIGLFGVPDLCFASSGAAAFRLGCTTSHNNSELGEVESIHSVKQSMQGLMKDALDSSICASDICLFPLLVVKGLYHHWKYEMFISKGQGPPNWCFGLVV